jgi:hypothetical protein
MSEKEVVKLVPSDYSERNIAYTNVPRAGVIDPNIYLVMDSPLWRKEAALRNILLEDMLADSISHEAEHLALFQLNEIPASRALDEFLFKFGIRPHSKFVETDLKKVLRFSHVSRRLSR